MGLLAGGVGTNHQELNNSIRDRKYNYLGDETHVAPFCEESLAVLHGAFTVVHTTLVHMRLTYYMDRRCVGNRSFLRPLTGKARKCFFAQQVCVRVFYSSGSPYCMFCPKPETPEKCRSSTAFNATTHTLLYQLRKPYTLVAARMPEVA